MSPYLPNTEIDTLFYDDSSLFNTSDLLPYSNSENLFEFIYCPNSLEMENYSFNMDTQSQEFLRPQQVEAFENLDVTKWKGDDCYKWALKVCRTYGIDHYSNVDLNYFRSLTGDRLLQFSENDFIHYTNNLCGQTFHREFQKLQPGCGIALSSPMQEPAGALSPMSEYSYDLPQDNNDLYELSPVTSTGKTDDLFQHTELTAVSPTNFLDIDNLNRSFPQSSYDNSKMHHTSRCDTESVFQDLSTASATLDDDEDISGLDNFVHGDVIEAKVIMENSSRLTTQEIWTEIKREEDEGSFFDDRYTERSISPDHSVPCVSALARITTSSRKRSRGPKNWEFVVRLLVSAEFNPSHIRWEDKETGTFRLVKPAAIAKMWGDRSNKPNLTYDNFARGLRYHYKTKALVPVSEKQLVYRCGPPAIDFLKSLDTQF